MSIPAKFKNGKISISEFSFDMPLRAYGHLRLFEQLEELNHGDINKIAHAAQVENHELLSKNFLVTTTAYVLQRLWFEEMGHVPETVQRNYEQRLREHAKLIDDIKKGKVTIMAEKKKKSAGAHLGRPVKPLLYKLLSTKIGDNLKKRIDNVETSNHDAIIVQVLSEYDGAKDLETITDKVKGTGRYKTNDKLPLSVRWHLNKLEKEGVVSAKEA